MKKFLLLFTLIAVAFVTGGSPVFAIPPTINTPSTNPTASAGIVYFVDEDTFQITFSGRSQTNPNPDFFDSIDIQITQGLDTISFSLEPDNVNTCIPLNCDMQALTNYGIESVSFYQTTQTFFPPYYADGFWTIIFNANKTTELIEATSAVAPLMFNNITINNVDGSSPSESYQYELTRVYKPVIESVSPTSGTIEVGENDTFDIRITAYDADMDLSNVDAIVGFNYSNNQTFTLCADDLNVYCGNEQPFIDYGITVQYVTYQPLVDPETRHEWTLTFDQERVAVFVQETVTQDLTLQILARDDFGNNSTVENRTYQFNYTEPEPDQVSSSSSSSRSGSSIVYGCKDENALNYNRFSSHRQSLCEYSAEVTTTGTVVNNFEIGSCILFVENMKRGDRNGVYSNYQQGIVTQVALLQERLGIESDGMFGPITQAAVRSFQTSKSLVADGIVGPLTLAELNLDCSN